MRQHILSLLFTALAVTNFSCGGKNTTSNSKVNPENRQTEDDKVLLQLGNAEDGLTILLSDGLDKEARSVHRKVAASKKLGPSQANQLLGRLPALNKKTGDTTDFSFREHSLPPPRTGKTVKHDFPAKPSIASKPSVGGKLEVVRFAPEGDVPLAPHLSVSFSQPMVAVTSHAASIKNVPVKLSPMPAGNWRWVGTRTLLFDPDVRFPMATKYDVSIAKGVKSANGDVLQEAKHFQFSTPGLTMKQSYPGSGPQKLQPTIFVSFDQKVDAQSILGHIKVEGKGKAYSIRMATEEEIKEDKRVLAMVESQRKRNVGVRWIAFVPKEKLPGGSTISVTISKGTPSAEGPLLTLRNQSFHFGTFAPLKIEQAYCNWGGNECPPGSSFSVRFNNPIDDELFDAANLLVHPVIPGYKAHSNGRNMTVAGRTEGRTTYTLKIPTTIKDVFGQSLDKEAVRTFKIGDAFPQLFGNTGLTIADPSAKTPHFDVHSINIKSLRVQIYKVSPKDWGKFGLFMQGNPRRPKPAPGKKVFDKRIRVKGTTDRMQDTPIDLSRVLNNKGKGHAVVVVEPSQWSDRYKPRIVSWVQITNIGMDAFTDASKLLAWTTTLSDGETLSDVKVSIAHTKKQAMSDSKGLVTFPLSVNFPPKNQHRILQAEKDGDVAFLPESTYYWRESSAFIGRKISDKNQWFIFDDRGMYKPGESVNLKGWIRNMTPGQNGDLRKISKGNQLEFKVVGARGNTLKTGTTKMNLLGGFDFKFDVPKNANLGRGQVVLILKGSNNGVGYHNFQIQEFRKPEFEVGATASEGPHIVGKGADVTVSAKYYAGGPLAGAEVSWNVSSTATNFTPPNQDKYDFGVWKPWWRNYHYRGNARQAKQNIQNFQSKTSASGDHKLHMAFVSVKPPRPMSVVARASVMDVNRQAWATSTTLLVHPSELYIGMKREKYFVEKGRPLRIDGVIVNQEGKAVPGRKATVRAVRLDWKYVKGEYKEEEKDPQVCEVNSGQDPFECVFQTPVGGRYKVVATVLDDLKRPNQSEFTIWVSGGERPPAREVEQEKITLIPDKKEYQAGDVAKIMVQAPFFPAEAVLTIRRSGIVRSETFRMEKGSKTIEVPILEGYVPNLFVQVDLVGSAVRVNDKGDAEASLPHRPAYAKGQLRLSVPPRQRTLQVSVAPRTSKMNPGSQASLAIEVRDANGKAVANADVTAFVVDEAVLALSNYRTPDPIAAMYPGRNADARDYHQRQWLKLAEPDLDTLLVKGDGAGDREFRENLEKDGAFKKSNVLKHKNRRAQKPKLAREKKTSGRNSASTPIAVRRNFAALAVFAPSVTTNVQGKAVLKFKLPDNLTRYRVIAVAAAGENSFGKGESNLTARKSLMLRPSPPRFLNFGDRFELPLIVQNQTTRPMEVKVAIRTTNTALLEGNGRIVTVPANDRVELRFPAAAEMAGIARFQVVATSGSHQDANEFSLPVWTPATTEAFATYGEIDSGAMGQPIAMPAGVVKDFGGLDISLSSTQLQALTDAFLYLVRYPYECAEQTSSRIMGVAALRDVLSAFEADGLPSQVEIEATVKRDIKRLSALQNYDGGFAFWLRGRKSWPYISIHAANALIRAKNKGFKVPEQMIRKSREYLRTIEKHIPSYYGVRARRMLISYALYVRNRMGDTDRSKAKKLIQRAGLKGLSMESIGWLMGVLHGDKGSKAQLTKMHRFLENKVTETASAANWVDGYSDDAHLILHSNRRVDAVLLEALIEDKPESDLIPKVVRGLLAHRKRGRWGNTQENVFVLQAMDAYFQKYEKVTPNFVVQMWLGDRFAGEQKFAGRSTERHQTHIPMQILAAQKNTKSDLVISKKGKGRLYYRIGMTYAPSDLELPPADHGFAVERRYEAVDNPGDVTQSKDGTWKIKAGSRVRVRLTMVAPSRRYHVALVDPLPAGLEAMNPALAVTGTIPLDPKAQKNSGRFWWWRGTWYEHQNMRDERVEAFTSLLWAGVHTYDYVTRATTPGRFVVPPTKAEEMYAPETFGRSGGDIVVIE